ncbi:N6-adenosine-methyltransferase MT-A70-like [Ricinus communis]|uniref:N6-adenosine-methyltransferase 70 kDa subunit, putative n=1 Tax=Ricinus communis TaxID=3988 RepID=B9RYS4_RICCO|nr:N6-adenosine-methyltransferase MT-A70-like [Ricinus communis]EEF43426.1 N6-adenosine-methyltransferase 70 kDa subunit, putative [Ricinus communis]|eukprot:XP_002518893.1 N6-adenosine-methyltransferase MT-A70-like [Ricinus communis]
METQSDGTFNSSDDTSSVSTIKTLRSRLESRIETQHNSQLDLIASLRSLVPNIVSSLDVSLQIVSSFNYKPFTPTPPLPNPTKTAIEITNPPQNPSSPQIGIHSKPESSNIDTKKPKPNQLNGNNDKFDIDENGSPLSVVRVMVAECLLQRVPFDPIDSSTVLRKLENDQNATAAEKAALREVGGESGAILAVEMALRSMAEENHGIELEEFVVSGKSRVMILNIDRNILVKELPESAQYQQQLESDLNQNHNQGNSNNGGVDVNNSGGFGMGGQVMQRPMPADMWMGGDMWNGPPRGGMVGPRGMMMGTRGMMQRPPLPMQQQQKQRTEEDDLKDLEALLNKKSFMEMQKSKTGEELLDLIHRPTAKETAVAAKFKTKGGSQLKEYCSALTKEDCRRQSGSFIACEKVHFRRIIAPHTDVSQGDCSFLDTCRHMKTCKYVHYELDPTPDVPPMMMGAPPKALKPQRAEYCSEVELGEPQWINCDIRNFKMEILGQFGVIMADPPWDIHMELPYGTMADDEMRNLNVPVLQTDGLIFLWVTGRAMELGRECLDLWGYKRVEEIIWVKTNQLQRIIRTGRTGHWLNHSKEHCLVGIKGNPEVNRNIDTDVIVAEVRETSRKPDEMYPLLERISPRTRKLELFARMHNTHAGWMSLGNQLEGVRLVDDGLRARFKAAYPDVMVQPSSPPRASAMEVESASQMRNPFAVTEPKSTAAHSAEHAALETAYISEEKPMAVDTDMAG